MHVQRRDVLYSARFQLAGQAGKDVQRHKAEFLASDDPAPITATWINATAGMFPS